jgi:hypothetical protein
LSSGASPTPSISRFTPAPQSVKPKTNFTQNMTSKNMRLTTHDDFYERKHEIYYTCSL